MQLHLTRPAPPALPAWDKSRAQGARQLVALQRRIHGDRRCSTVFRVIVARHPNPVPRVGPAQAPVVARQHLAPVAQHRSVVGLQIVRAHGGYVGTRLGISEVLRHHRPMPDRLFQGAAFVTALQTAARKNPGSWRSVTSIGRDAGIDDPSELSRAVRDAVNAGRRRWLRAADRQGAWHRCGCIREKEEPVTVWGRWSRARQREAWGIRRLADEKNVPRRTVLRCGIRPMRAHGRLGRQ
jgi:hypothetical protein